MSVLLVYFRYRTNVQTASWLKQTEDALARLRFSTHCRPGFQRHGVKKIVACEILSLFLLFLPLRLDFSQFAQVAFLQGAKLLQSFRWFLNPRQVFDLSQENPTEA